MWLRGARLGAPLFICAFIERPSPLEKSSCKVRLFAQNCFRKYRQKVAAITLSKPFLIPLFNLSHKRPTFAFTSESGYTLGFRRRIAHSGLHAETGGVSDGGGITTLGAFRTFTNIPGPGIRTASFAAFGAWSGVLPKNAESLRNSDALMRVAVPRRRGPAGLRNPFSFLSKLRLVCPALRAFPCVRGEGWYHYPQRALRAAETPDGRLPKGLICRFLRLPSSTPCAVTFSANTQISLSAISVANTFALWYDKS